MSKSLMKRLERLEVATDPKVLGRLHVIYERSPEDFADQRVELIRSGRAKAADFFFEWNFNLPLDQREFREPETIQVTGTHEERLEMLARQECPR